MNKLGVLLVEDQPGLAFLYIRMLERLGYRVLATVSSAEAALGLGSDLVFDLLVTDVCLAGDMNGIQLAKMVSSRHGIPVVIMSCLCRDDLCEMDAAVMEYECLSKPFGMEHLRQAILRAYDGLERERNDG
jgi:DNA-binding NtrC family response regulator